MRPVFPANHPPTTHNPQMRFANREMLWLLLVTVPIEQAEDDASSVNVTALPEAPPVAVTLNVVLYVWEAGTVEVMLIVWLAWVTVKLALPLLAR